MSILIDQSNRVIIQGITGREGITRARLMKDYGTTVVGGVTPGKGGDAVEGIPVFDTVREACERIGPIDTSVLFVPAPLVRNAALEALDAGIKLLVIGPARVPIYDVLDIAMAGDRLRPPFLAPSPLLILTPLRPLPGTICPTA